MQTGAATYRQKAAAGPKEAGEGGEQQTTTAALQAIIDEQKEVIKRLSGDREEYLKNLGKTEVLMDVVEKFHQVLMKNVSESNQR